MKKLFLFWLLCPALLLQCSKPATFTGKPETPDEFDRQILFHIHNADYAIADSLIGLRLKEMPDHPKYYFLKSSLLFHARYFYATPANRDSIKNLFADYCRHTIRLAEKLPPTTENKFYLGSAHSYLSRVHIMNQSFTDAYFDAASGQDYLEEVIEENPEFYDAYLNLGVMKYFIATRTNWWQSALAFLSGMSGDKETALRELRLVQEKGAFNKNEASFILGQVYQFFENSTENARYYQRQYHETFPNNAFMTRQYNMLALTDLINERGVLYFESHMDSLIAEYGLNNAGLLNTIGYRLITDNKTEDALVIFRANMKLFPEVANCYDSYAEANMLLGRKEEAIKYYTTAYEKTKTDQTLNEEFRKTLQTGIQDKLKELKK